MPILLRDYQAELEASTGQALRRVKRVLLQCPPGGGKTAIATSIASKFAARSSQAWFICHRAELVEQTSKTFHKHGLPHAYIAAGYPMNLQQLVQVCSIDTLKNRLDKLKAPRIAIVDEAHHGGAAGWAMVIQWLVDNGAQVIGLSGTPHRHDGTGLDAHFDELVLGPAVAWLMEHGHLSQYEIYAPSAPDMKGVRKMMGDYAKADTEERMRKPKLTGDMISHWLKHAKGKRTIGFAVNIAHSLYLTDQFRAAGIKAAHLDGNTDKGERRRIIDEFAGDDPPIIFNVGLFGEGFDLAAIAQKDVTIKAMIDAAPTMSLSWYLQKVMRPMRPGEPAIILDHAGNCHRHGFPDDDREWSLEGKGGGKKAANDNAPPPPITCDGCFRQIKRPLPECCPNPECGKRLLADVKPPEVADGELGKVSEEEKRSIRALRKQEEADCKTLDDWVSLGRKRGYDFPLQWGQKRYGFRAKRSAA